MNRAAYIVSAVRTPMGKFGGALRELTAADLGVAVAPPPPGGGGGGGPHGGGSHPRGCPAPPGSAWGWKLSLWTKSSWDVPAKPAWGQTSPARSPYALWARRWEHR